MRSVVRPPQVRDRKAEVPLNQATPRRALESSTRWSSSGSTNNLSEVSIGRDARDPHLDEKQEHYHEDVSLSLMCLCMCSFGSIILFFYLSPVIKTNIKSSRAF